MTPIRWVVLGGKTPNLHHPDRPCSCIRTTINNWHAYLTVILLVFIQLTYIHKNIPYNFVHVILWKSAFVIVIILMSRNFFSEILIYKIGGKWILGTYRKISRQRNSHGIYFTAVRTRELIPTALELNTKKNTKSK